MNFLRLSFFLLVLANLLFFAWAHGYLGTSEEGREPQRLTSQLSPEKLRILSNETTAAPAAVAAGSHSPVASSPVICRLINGLTSEEALQLQSKLSENLPELQAQVKPLEIQPGYWTFIPPQANQAAADKKMDELKKLNIPNFADFQLILEEGTDKFAISLGMFDEESAASAYLKSLAKYGIRTAKIQLRSRPTEKAQLEAHGPAALMQRLAELTSASIGECPTATAPTASNTLATASTSPAASSTATPAAASQTAANSAGNSASKPSASAKKAQR